MNPMLLIALVLLVVYFLTGSLQSPIQNAVRDPIAFIAFVIAIVLVVGNAARGSTRWMPGPPTRDRRSSRTHVDSKSAWLAWWRARRARSAGSRRQSRVRCVERAYHRASGWREWLVAAAPPFS